MGRFERHFFVCQTQRPPSAKQSCGARGATDVYNALVEGLGARPDLWGKIAVTSSGCLGPCFDGPTIVVYPDGVWYAGVTEADVNEIIESHMVAGKPVERLVYRWPEE